VILKENLAKLNAIHANLNLNHVQDLQDHVDPGDQKEEEVQLELRESKDPKVIKVIKVNQDIPVVQGLRVPRDLVDHKD
jgi:hypothetical protein